MGNLVPLSEMPDHFDEDSNIAWKVDAGPYIDTDRLGFDVQLARRILRWGGLAGVLIHGYQGDQSSVQVNATGITGINPDGSATGTGTASVAKVETNDSELMDTSSGNMFAGKWPLARVGLNRTELASLIADDVRRGTPRDEAWARHYSRAITKGIARAALGSLVKKPLKDFVVTMNSAMYTTSMAINTFQHDAQTIALLAAFNQVITLGITGLSNKVKYGTPDWRNIRISLFPWGFQPDRLAVAAILGASKRLIRPLPAGQAPEAA